MEAVAITINSIHRNDYVLADAGVEWTKALQQTGTARFKMAGLEGAWVPLVGQAFGIYDTSVPGWGDPWQLGLIFAGSIDSVTPERPAPGAQPDWLQIEITGSSREQTLQRRLIRPFGFGYRYSRYKDMTAGAIAQAVLTDFADGENLVIEPANFDDGPTVPFVAWNHQTVGEALTQLADYAEMHWWVAPDSRVYFREREAVFAPWGIVDGDNQCLRLTVRESRENLSNAVYFRTAFGQFATDPLPEFKNPSETVVETVAGQTFFQTEMQILEVIDIAVEGPAHDGRYPSTIGQADGTEDEFWFIPGDDGFSRTTGKPDLPAGTVITLHYNRLGGDVLPVEDATAISDRAAVELVGSGRYELAVSSSANLSKAAAEQRASMILQQRRNTALVVEGETFRKGLDVGQALVISTENPPINDTFLLTTVTGRTVPGTAKIRWNFTGVNGAKLPTGWDFFTGLGDSGFGGGFGAGFLGATAVGGAGAGGGGANLADLWREVPFGTIDGSNREFYLTHTVKPPWSLELKLNQTTQNPISNAVQAGPIVEYLYELSGNRITYKTAPQPGDVHDASYWKDKKVDYSTIVSATISLVTAASVSLTYDPIIHLQGGVGPVCLMNLGVNSFSGNHEVVLAGFVDTPAPGWDERTDTQTIPGTLTKASLESYAVTCDIVGTVGGDGLTVLTIYDCWMEVTYASGAVITIRPGTKGYALLWGGFFGAPAVIATPYTGSFPTTLERSVYSGLGEVPHFQLTGFVLP